MTQETRPARRTSLIVTIWAETQPGRPVVWRGYLETPTIQRVYFDSLPALAALLQAFGWNDPPEDKEVV